MDKEAGRSRFVLPLLGGLAAVVAAFAGSASISDRSASSLVAPVERKTLIRVAAHIPLVEANAAGPAAEDASRILLQRGGAVRKKVRCAGCGVVESVRRIERREIAAGVCSFADSDRFWIKGDTHDGGEYGNVATLADTVEGVLAGRTGAKKMMVTSSYQIVVRFRDGTRRVFNEATARVMQSGEHVQVIAGAELSAE